MFSVKLRHVVGLKFANEEVIDGVCSRFWESAGAAMDSFPQGTSDATTSIAYILYTQGHRPLAPLKRIP